MKAEICIKNWKITHILWQDLPDKTKYLQQTHSNIIVNEKEIRNGTTEGDGIVACPGSFVAIKTADCLPMIIINGKKALSLHVSRKNLITGILDFATQYISITSNTNIYLGPRICPKHFTFDYEGEKIKLFKNKFPEAVNIKTKIHLSMRQAVQRYLTKWNIGSNNIIEDKRCTYEDKSLPSYRQALDSNIGLKNHIATLLFPK